MAASWPRPNDLDDSLRRRLASLIDEGKEIWKAFEGEVRRERWHPFVAADYWRVMDALVPLRRPPGRFLEWGSATGIITIMADLLGFEAYGIELDGDLVRIARGLADRHDSRARFADGSFLPGDYSWDPPDGDGRLGTIGHGRPAYPALGRSLDDFEIVFAYPWSGEAEMMLDLMHLHGRPGALLLLYDAAAGVHVHCCRQAASQRTAVPQD